MAAAAALPSGLLLAALRVPMAASAAADERPAAPAPSPVPPAFALVAAGYGFGPLGDRRTALRRPEPRKGRNRRQ